jgi:DNA polymerase V
MKMNEISLKFGQALKEARLSKGLSQEELALESELDRTYISMLERDVKNPTLGTISKLSKSLGITPLDLVSRSQQLAGNTLSSRSSFSRKPSTRPLFYGTSVSCGKPFLGEHSTEKELSLDEEFVKNPTDTFFIKSSGDSMTPTIWDGDIMIISKRKKPQNGQVVLAQIGNEYTIKRYFKTNKGIKLVPDNGDHNEISVDAETEGMICGVVTGICRSL